MLTSPIKSMVLRSAILFLFGMACQTPAFADPSFQLGFGIKNNTGEPIEVSNCSTQCANGEAKSIVTIQRSTILYDLWKSTLGLTLLNNQAVYKYSQPIFISNKSNPNPELCVTTYAGYRDDSRSDTVLAIRSEEVVSTNFSTNFKCTATIAGRLGKGFDGVYTERIIVTLDLVKPTPHVPDVPAPDVPPVAASKPGWSVLSKNTYAQPSHYNIAGDAHLGICLLGLTTNSTEVIFSQSHGSSKIKHGVTRTYWGYMPNSSDFNLIKINDTILVKRMSRDECRGQTLD